MSEKSKKDLFADFKVVSQEEWQKQAEKEIAKGGGKVSQLGKRADKFGTKPYYTEKESISLDFSTPKSGSSWIQERIAVKSESKDNKKLLEDLSKGVNSILFDLNDSCDFQSLLSEVLLDAVDLNWYFDKDVLNNAIQLETHLSETGIKTGVLKGSVNLDCIANALTAGKWEVNEKEDLAKQVELFSRLFETLPSYRLVVVNGTIYHNAGASAVTELACILAHANEYMSTLHAKNLPFKQWSESFQVNMSVGKNYFAEIAKFRALRLLWKHLLSGHGKPSANSCFVAAENSLRHMSKTESQLNILRATTAAMSASIGGCDSLYLYPFDKFENKEGVQSSRIALNIHHLIREESYLEKTADPASGSYMLDQLTNEIAEEAWKEFLAIENSGGFIENIKKGDIQNKINQEAAIEEKAVLNNELTILGVNKHRLNKKEAAVKSETNQVNEKSEITKLSLKRLSELME